MKKSELRQIIREEVMNLREGSDWIMLPSLGKNMAIDSHGGFFFNIKRFHDPEIMPGTMEWKISYAKLNSKDKKTVNSIMNDIHFY